MDKRVKAHLKKLDELKKKNEIQVFETLLYFIDRARAESMETARLRHVLAQIVDMGPRANKAHALAKDALGPEGE
jgi:tRNA C32,U32 (ribose-2'-O)-methylase TrmJ